MASREVWRKVSGQAIRCTECRENRKVTVANSEEEPPEQPVGADYICEAKDEVCVFLKEKLDSQKTYTDFHDAFRDIQAERDRELQEAMRGEET